MTRFFRFPNPVDEVSARLVAGGVVLMSAAVLVLDQTWIIVLLAYGFVARVLTGPTLSPLGQLVTRVIRARVPVAPRPVPGPPKRFAQGVGATLAVTSLGLLVALDAVGEAKLLVAAIALAATLESVFGYCLGCAAFALLTRVGVVPASVCDACADVGRRTGQMIRR